MAGYDPSCPNCHRCGTCRGDGTVEETRSDSGKVWKERVTCRTCNGVGGRAGAGPHNHR
jgi:DnaJ-class molecular chaperone